MACNITVILRQYYMRHKCHMTSVHVTKFHRTVENRVWGFGLSCNTVYAGIFTSPFDPYMAASYLYWKTNAL